MNDAISYSIDGGAISNQPFVCLIIQGIIHFVMDTVSQPDQLIFPASDDDNNSTDTELQHQSDGEIGNGNDDEGDILYEMNILWEIYLLHL